MIYRLEPKETTFSYDPTSGFLTISDKNSTVIASIDLNEQACQLTKSGSDKIVIQLLSSIAQRSHVEFTASNLNLNVENIDLNKTELDGSKEHGGLLSLWLSNQLNFFASMDLRKNYVLSQQGDKLRISFDSTMGGENNLAESSNEIVAKLPLSNFNILSNVEEDYLEIQTKNSQSSLAEEPTVVAEKVGFHFEVNPANEFVRAQNRRTTSPELCIRVNAPQFNFLHHKFHVGYAIGDAPVPDTPIFEADHFFQLVIGAGDMRTFTSGTGVVLRSGTAISIEAEKDGWYGMSVWS